MHVFVNETLNYDGREIPCGVHEFSAVEAASLFARGAVRPATVDEIERADIRTDREGSPETAARKPATGGKTAAAKAAPAPAPAA